MTASTESAQSRIICDGFNLLSTQPLHVKLFVIPRANPVSLPIQNESIQVFRRFRIEHGYREEKSNIKVDVDHESALILNDFYLSPDFGISLTVNPDLMRLELHQSVSPDDNFLRYFQFETNDGTAFTPRCYFKVL